MTGGFGTPRREAKRGRSAAAIPVVALEGRSGGYDLERVTPMERQDTTLT